MALETWNQPGKPPAGEGWQITGYSTVRRDLPKGGWQTSQVPIYSRMAGQTTAPAVSASTPTPTSGTPSLRIQPQDPVPLVGTNSSQVPQLAIGGFDALNRPLTAADRAGQGVNNESVEDFMKRYNAQKDWVKAGMDITNWSPQGMIDPNKGQTTTVSEAARQSLMVGQNASVDGNAMGFTRAKSSARKAGLTTKGTSRLRITRGQTTASSGLNIGV